MNLSPILKFNEEQNLFHDKFLDVVGAGFNFNHEKGLAEWLKNSVDAYRRIGELDKNQYIVLRFTDGIKDSNPPIIECVDFVGMEINDIEKAFKWWGDPNAASRGKFKVFGGHGNGGKFYMRQMFQQSYFITYKAGKLNIFGFNENQKYGFADGFKNKIITPIEALKVAGIEQSLIPDLIFNKIINNKTGFTVVKGIRPKKNVGNKLPVARICEKLKYHPQARTPLKYCNVSVIYNGRILTQKLRMEEIEPMEGFEEIYTFDIPEYLQTDTDSKKVKMFDKKYEQGHLILRTSAQPFGRGGNRAELNCIDIVGEIGVIASYNMEDIGFLRYFPQAQYIYGECKCPILENPEDDCVQNDREKLVANDSTDALRKWICGKIDEIAGKIAKKDEEDEEKENTKVTDEFNQILNKWKNQFMSKLFTEVLGGPGKGISTGGQGEEGSGGGSNNNSEEKGGRLGVGGSNKGGGEGEEKKKGLRAPLVLLSGQEDPDYPGTPVNFSERHFTVEQRQQDVERGIYWINRDKPMAKKIINKYGVDSPRWRNYLFQRYIDIFTIETIERLAKKEGGTLTKDQTTQEIMRISSLVYDKASVDLEGFLLNERYKDNEK